MKRNTYISAFLCFIGTIGNAQTNLNFNLFSGNPFLVGPNFVGEGNGTNLNTHYRNQYADFVGSPVTQMFTFDHAFEDKNFGLGAKIFNDRLGIVNASGFELAYAYRFNLNKEVYMKLGLSALISQKSIDFDQANIDDNTEIGLMQGVYSNTLFDGNFGVSVHGKAWRFGLAVPQIMQSDVKFENFDQPSYLKMQNRRAYQLYADYKWVISEDLSLRPALFVRYIGESGLNYDVTAIALIKNALIVGAGYHNDYAVSATAGLQLVDGLRFVYNFSVPITELGKVSYGGHEVMLGYSFSLASPKEDSKANRKETERINDRLFEQEKANIRQLETINRLQSKIDGKDPSAELARIKEASLEKLRTPPSSADYYLILGSFSDLQTARDFQEVLLRKSQSFSTRIVKEGDWFLVYRQKFSTADQAKRASSSTSGSEMSLEDIWVFVQD